MFKQMTTVHHLVFVSYWCLMMLSPACTADQFDVANNGNSVCFTSEDCHRNSGAEDDDDGQTPPSADMPLFCRSPLECLCNRQQLHSHSHSDVADLLTKCVPCNQANSDQVDPCTVQDPYSFCNNTSSLCECSLTAEDVKRNTTKGFRWEVDLAQTALFSRSICLHLHLDQHSLVDNQSSAGSNGTQMHHLVTEVEPISERLLGILLAYVLPSVVVFVFVYFIYRQGCFCGRRDDADSEMILYRQL